jgi:hypothetical protein
MVSWKKLAAASFRVGPPSTGGGRRRGGWTGVRRGGKGWRPGVFAAALALAVGAVAASRPAAEKPPIPPDLLFVPRAIEREDNGIWYWRRAASVEIVPDRHLKEVVSYAWRPEARRPTGSDGDAVQNWLRSNREALALIETSLGKSNCLWLARTADEEQPELLAFMSLICARLVQADEMAERCQFTNAARSLRGSMRMTRMAVEGDGGIVHYVYGARARSWVHGAIVRLASRSEVPAAVLEDLQELLPRLDSDTNVYAHALCVEFTVNLYPAINLARVVQGARKLEASHAIDQYFDEPFRRPFCILTDPGLVALHPRPLDEAADANSAIANFRVFRTNALLPWKDRSTAFEEDMIRNARGLLLEIAPLMEVLKDEPLPLSRQAIGKAQDAYGAITNPLGRITFCSRMNFILSERSVFQHRTEREVARVVLATKIFEHRKGQLPASLCDLVEAGLLDSLPIDYFSGEPLKYSKARRLIWSVKENGVDDGGTQSAQPPKDDAVWKIPETLKP